MVEPSAIKGGNVCHICQIHENEPFLYGPIYQLNDISAHYYCVLLSSNLMQNGEDHEGILGFLLKDIKLLLTKISRNKCIYCGKTNANIRCAHRKCRKMFHLPCGIEAGALNQFFNQFKSFCSTHRPIQKIPRDILEEAKSKKVSCYICLDELDIKDNKNFLWAPCCLKTWYHRYCLQKLAYNAGYLFKCSICSNTKKFLEWTQQFGIYVPQQDAAWELEPNAYQDLLYKYDKCDASVCLCPKGRNKTIENSKWEVVPCVSCGSQGIHVACGKLKYNEDWECKNCLDVTARISSMNTSNNCVSQSSSKKGGNAPSNQILISRKRKPETEDVENVFRAKRKKNHSRLSENEDLMSEIDEETFNDDILNSEELTTSELNSQLENISVSNEIIRVQDNYVREENGEKVAEFENVLNLQGLDEIDNRREINRKEDERENIKVISPEEDSDCLIDIESISSEPPLSWEKTEMDNILNCIRPGPLSYKLGVIQEILNATVETKNSDLEVTFDARTQKIPEVINLDDEEDDDIQILHEKLVNSSSVFSDIKPANVSTDESEIIEISSEDESSMHADNKEMEFSDSGIFDIIGAINFFQMSNSSGEISLEKSNDSGVLAG